MKVTVVTRLRMQARADTISKITQSVVERLDVPVVEWFFWKAWVIPIPKWEKRGMTRIGEIILERKSCNGKNQLITRCVFEKIKAGINHNKFIIIANAANTEIIGIYVESSFIGENNKIKDKYFCIFSLRSNSSCDKSELVLTYWSQIDIPIDCKQIKINDICDKKCGSEIPLWINEAYGKKTRWEDGTSTLITRSIWVCDNDFCVLDPPIDAIGAKFEENLLLLINCINYFPD